MIATAALLQIVIPPDASSQAPLQDILRPWTRQALEALAGLPLIGSLLLLIALDILTGMATAIIRRQLSSSLSFRGMFRKVIMLLMVAFGAVLEPFTGGIPVARIIALGFCVTESLSIVENAGLAGVPLPRVVTETIIKMRESTDRPKANATDLRATLQPPVPDPPRPAPPDAPGV